MCGYALTDCASSRNENKRTPLPQARVVSISEFVMDVIVVPHNPALHPECIVTKVQLQTALAAVSNISIEYFGSS